MTAYTSDLNSIDNPATGAAAPAAWGDGVRDNFLAIGEAWTSFTPTWTATTTNPVINNGTIAGAYKQLGKLLFVRYRIVMGSTTTYGSGSWKLRLPNSLSAAAGTTQIIPVWALDSGTAYRLGAGVIGTEPLADFDDFSFVSDAGAGAWTATAPHTWAAGDVLVAEGAIEVA